MHVKDVLVPGKEFLLPDSATEYLCDLEQVTCLFLGFLVSLHECRNSKSMVVVGIK